MTEETSVWPIGLADVFEARRRIRPHIAATPLRRYAGLDESVGNGITVWVKHENQNPTNSFKVRNALSVMTRFSGEERRRGVITATRGNHGLGVAWAGSLLGIGVTICVPRGSNPEKNEGMRGLGATLIEEGRDYDESLEVALRLARERDLRMVHSTNDRNVIAGAATVTLEMLEEQPEIEALIVAVGGGSQAVGALTVARAVNPQMPVYAVQAELARRRTIPGTRGARSRDPLPTPSPMDWRHAASTT